MRTVMLLALVATIACAREADIEGVQVVGNSTQPWVAAPDFTARVLSRAAVSTEYWGADLSVLDGWTIEVVDGNIDCGGRPAGGCTNWGRKRITLSTQFGPCVEAMPLPHEVGHVVAPEAGHSDPRYNGLPAAGLTASATNCPQEVAR